MGTWNLHIVGQELEDVARSIGAEIVALLESKGHTLTSATLTTDAGSEPVPVTPPPEPEPAPEAPVEEPDNHQEDIPADNPPEPPVA